MEKKPWDIFAQRLHTLTQFLEAVPPKKFRFSHFIGKEWQGDPELSCGTTACGMGFGVLLFGKECGVELVRDLVYGAFFPLVVGSSKLLPPGSVDEAGKVMFDLEEDEVDRLFIPFEHLEVDEPPPYGRLGPNATAKELAAHIRKFVEEKYDASSA